MHKNSYTCFRLILSLVIIFKPENNMNYPIFFYYQQYIP